ncbi:MAG TPA: IreB family regulatory phosphoprotein [Syntrophomonadaceae bacterium]|nr:IreB family regulatory phosphoprotein [Syntrophomonadaceae bacterium]
MPDELDKTMTFNFKVEETASAREVLKAVYKALREKGYNPISQLVGYLLSGDPAYITNHQNARNLIRKYERDELLEELIKYYLEKGE